MILEDFLSNERFLPTILNTLLFYFDQFKKDPHKSNLLFSIAFILMTLSSNREFSMLINEKYVMELPFDLPDYDGNTYADLLL